MVYDYFVLPKVYTKEQCSEIYEFAKTHKSFLYEDEYSKELMKSASVFLVETEDIQHKLKRFFDVVKEVNEEYFGFKVFSYHPPSVNVNTYDAIIPRIGSEDDWFKVVGYDYHRDHVPCGRASDMKLTAILNISPDEYTGGDFDIFLGKDVTIPQIHEPGTMLIFPSHFYHRVGRMISGRRVTISCWFTGPNWR